MTGLTDGKYSLLVKAWDIRNNSSQAVTNFVVSSTTDLEMANVVNYPNPFSRSTTFTFQRNSEDPIDVEIKIYTIAGRLIQHLDSYSVVDRFVQIPWDGRDHDGDPLANGIYLYKVTAKTEDRRVTKEELGKLVIMR
jgi:flagellar hook assembly protein FlgD